MPTDRNCLCIHSRNPSLGSRSFLVFKRIVVKALHQAMRTACGVSSSTCNVLCTGSMLYSGSPSRCQLSLAQCTFCTRMLFIAGHCMAGSDMERLDRKPTARNSYPDG